SSFTFSLPSHPLNRIHHIRLLGEESVTEIGCPLDIAGHSLNHVWVSCQSLNAWVPRLFRDSVRQRFIFQILVPVHPLLKLDHLQRISGRGECLSQEWI